MGMEVEDKPPEHSHNYCTCMYMYVSNVCVSLHVHVHCILFWCAIVGESVLLDLFAVSSSVFAALGFSIKSTPRAYRDPSLVLMIDSYLLHVCVQYSWE